MITIVGATGNIGGKTAEHLLAAGKSVKAIARNAEKLAHLQAKGAEIAIGDSTDVAFLTEAFKGSEAVLVMMSAKMDAEDIKAYQDLMGEAHVAAIKASGVKNIVFISSQGAHTEDKTGIVAGLARQELRLNALEGVNVLSLRPTSFMENSFNSIGLIKGMGINGSSVAADKTFPMIATQDIAEVAAKKLANLDFIGKTHQDLLGAKDYSPKEFTTILGKAIGKPDLAYVVFKPEDEKAGLMQYGISASVADSFVGLNEGINLGRVNEGIRNETSTTPTTAEWFAENVFKYAFN